MKLYLCCKGSFWVLGRRAAPHQLGNFEDASLQHVLSGHAQGYNDLSHCAAAGQAQHAQQHSTVRP